TLLTVRVQAVEPIAQPLQHLSAPSGYCLVVYALILRYGPVRVPEGRVPEQHPDIRAVPTVRAHRPVHVSHQCPPPLHGLRLVARHPIPFARGVYGNVVRVEHCRERLSDQAGRVLRLDVLPAHYLARWAVYPGLVEVLTHLGDQGRRAAVVLVPERVLYPVRVLWHPRNALWTQVSHHLPRQVRRPGVLPCRTVRNAHVQLDPRHLTSPLGMNSTRPPNTSSAHSTS